MHHAFIDQYSELESPIHRAKAERKIILVLLGTIGVVITPPIFWIILPAYLIIILAVVLISQVPPAHHLKRLATLLPFVSLVALSAFFTQNGSVIFFGVVAKAALSILTLSVLFSTTPFPKFLKALENMRFPKIFILLFSFMYRYVFIFEDELMRLQQAAQARNFSGSSRRKAKVLTNMTGTMLIRAYERGERVYQAMTARGYAGL